MPQYLLRSLIVCILCHNRVHYALTFVVVVRAQLVNLHGKNRMAIMIWAIIIYVALEAISPTLVGYLI